MITERTHERVSANVLTFQWLAGILLSVVMSIGGWNLKNAFEQINDLKSKQAATEISFVNLKNDIDRVHEAQERDHKLIVKIAQKMGIEVGE